jgi:periplasmic protein TonB
MTGTLNMPPLQPTTANDRLKRSFEPWFWGSLALAAILHFALLTLFPQLSTADLSRDVSPMQQLDIPPQVEIPPPPEAIQRPQVPVVSTSVMVDDDLTIPPVTFGENPVSQLPPPPGRGVDVSDAPPFTPYEVKPELRDRTGFARILERRYPPMLRDAGIGGTVLLWVHIDEQGRVRETRVTRASGYEQLDEAARGVLSEARFTPALNRDQRVAVWVQIPVTFQTR